MSVQAIDAVFKGRLRAIALAWLVTVALPMIHALFLPGSVTLDAVVFFSVITLIFVGMPAFFGIVCLMVPLHYALRRYGEGVSALGVVTANVLLVGVLWRTGVLPMQRDGLTLYLAFAAAAAGVWVAIDWHFRRLAGV